MLSAARAQARSKFESERSLDPGSSEAEQKIGEAEEIARILRQNIVQGEQVAGIENGGQRYRALLPRILHMLAVVLLVCSRHELMQGACVELRIHEETERGDNESIKKASNLTAAGVSCCGGAT